ncbi:hypothetical protein D3C86_1543230 [compost metagenome]
MEKRLIAAAIGQISNAKAGERRDRRHGGLEELAVAREPESIGAIAEGDLDRASHRCTQEPGGDRVRPGRAVDSRVRIGERRCSEPDTQAIPDCGADLDKIPCRHISFSRSSEFHEDGALSRIAPALGGVDPNAVAGACRGH